MSQLERCWNNFGLRHLRGLLLLACILQAGIAVSQATAVPVNVQYALFIKILSFDRRLDATTRNEIIIGIVYEGNFGKSTDVKNKLVAAMDEVPANVKGIPIRYDLMDLDAETDFSRLVAKRHPDLVYVAPLQSTRLETITSVSRAKKILTLSGVPEFVESGLAVGIGVSEARPQILINLPAAKAEGADFESQLLKIAKVLL